MRRVWIISCCLNSLFLFRAGEVKAEEPITHPAAEPKVKSAGTTGVDMYADANLKLSSSDPSIVQQGAKEFRTVFERLLKHGFSSDDITSLKHPFDAKQYDLVYELALNALTQKALKVDREEACLTWMIQARLSTGKPEDALSLAKSLYCVCRMEKTKDAIEAICNCLYEVHKNDDPNIVRRFRAQQLQGTVATSATQPAQLSEPSILDSIKIDPKPFESALAKARIAATRRPAWLGDLLLISGQAKEAEEMYRKMLAMSTEHDVYLNAVSGVARSIRAQDGTVGRANQFIVEQRLQAQDGNADSK